jgi:hypothetical protein
MYFTSKEASEILRGLQVASVACCKVLNVPCYPEGKSRPWKEPGGPVGLGIHYTGGPCGIRTLRWFNDPSFKNKITSCHVLVFDRIPAVLTEIWPKQEISEIFQVPTLLIFDPAKGAQHINWGNSRLLGIENRNSGYFGYNRVQGGLLGLEKEGFRYGSRLYEPYWRGQIESNILLGRLWAAIRGGNFRPEWICGHSQIWATKLDPGPHYPSMHEMREAIWSDQKLADIEWLKRYDEAPGVEDDPIILEEDIHPYGDQRGDPPVMEFQWRPDEKNIIKPDAKDQPEVSYALWELGWPTGPECITPRKLKSFISYYQRSTTAWRYVNKEDRVLRIDGIAGSKTCASLRQRLRHLRI